MSSVDVFIPCYEYGRYLSQCVGSALDQTGPSVRVLIIDDASPDETPEVARELQRKDKRVTYVRHPSNKGHIATYNEGLAWATADYTLLLSADDWLLPGALARAVAILDADRSIGLAYGDAIEMHDDAVVIQPGYVGKPSRTMSGEEFLWESRHGNPVVTCTAVVRTSAQRAVGGYRPELPHAGDLEMWMRFAAWGRVARVSEKQGVYRRHYSNMSNFYFQDITHDLLQRKALLDIFFENSVHSFSNSGAIETMLRRGLAEHALSSATADSTPRDRYSTIMALSEKIDPTIRGTMAWRKQQFKHFIGPRFCAGWRQLRSMRPGLL